jgi:glucuronoarabinoxylan endo-1,4-beta-xylanase
MHLWDSMNILRFGCTSILVTLLITLDGCGNGSTAAPPAAPLIGTTTFLTATPNPASVGATVNATATVSTTFSVPVDTVTFYDGTTSLGSATLGPGTPAVANQSVATLPITTFTANSSHVLTATFNGDGIHSGSTSSAVGISVGGAVAPQNINAHATFSFTTANQTISGFGAAEAFDLQDLDTHPYSSEMYKALFDPTAGLGLTYLRVQNLYRGTANSTFDQDTPSIVSAANAAHGTPLSILMSSWSPPANLKSNGTVNGCTSVTNGSCSGGIGTLVQVGGNYDYTDFAQYWYDSLNAYAALGVKPSYISIQNEPDFSATYAGCRFNPTEAPYNGVSYAGYGLAFDAVYKKLLGLTSITPPVMIGPESFNVGQSFLDLSAQIPAKEVGVYAHHNYNVNSGSASTAGVITPGGSPDTGVAAMTAAAAAYPGALKFTTEYYDTPGFYDAWTIHNALVYANDSAYVYWQAVWPSQLTSAKDQSADQEGLIYADNPFAAQSTWAFAHGWTYNDSYYSLKHYSYFVRPGYIRYNATIDNADERISVFQSPDKKTTVIVVLNVSATAIDGLSLNLSGITFAKSTIYRSSFMQPILTGERFANLGSYIAPGVTSGSNTNGGINLPPQSAVTIVLTN